MFILTSTPSLPKSTSNGRSRFELPERDDVEEGDMRKLGEEDSKMKHNFDLGGRDDVEESSVLSAREKKSTTTRRRAKTTKAKHRDNKSEIHVVSSRTDKLVEENLNLVSEIDALHVKVEETTKQLEIALKDLESLKTEKYRIQEKLKEKKLSELALAEENKMLQDEVEDLKLQLEEFAEEYVELEQELEEEMEFADKVDKALGKRSMTLKRLEGENNRLQESLDQLKLSEAALTSELEALREREYLLNNELEEYERKNYKQRLHASEKDNKKLQEKIKGLEEALEEQLQIKCKLDEDRELTLKEQCRLQDQIDGLQDVIEELMSELKKADAMIQDSESKAMDRAFYISQLSNELDIAYVQLLQNYQENELNLEAIKREHEEDLKVLSKEKEEQYEMLTDRISGLNEVLEGTSEELRKAYDNIRDMEIKSMDQSFYISELSKELDASIDLQLKIQNNCNPKIRAMWNTQVEEYKAHLKEQFGKYMQQEFEEELKLVTREKEKEIDLCKKKIDELSKCLQETQLQLKCEAEKDASSSIHLKMAKQARTIEMLKCKVTKMYAAMKQTEKETTSNEDGDILCQTLSLSEEWYEYYHH